MAKHQRIEDHQKDAAAIASSSQNDEPVKYEKHWNNGGTQRYYGGYMQPGQPRPSDFYIAYYCEAYCDWFPVPDGFVAPMPSGGFDERSPFDNI